jgi:integrase/recombinase XerD
MLKSACLRHPVLMALEAVPKISKRYFFWTSESKVDSATGDWQRTLKGVFKQAGIPDGHAHRFRDTFAVGLLQAGVPMERVSALLGHSSIKVTEKHYSPWVRARQEQLGVDARLSCEGRSRKAAQHDQSCDTPARATLAPYGNSSLCLSLLEPHNA